MFITPSFKKSLIVEQLHDKYLKRIVLDLHDVIADSRKVVLFVYEMPLLSQSAYEMKF